MSSLVSNGPPIRHRLHDPLELQTHSSRGCADGISCLRLEEVEAGLVLGNEDRAHEPDLCPLAVSCSAAAERSSGFGSAEDAAALGT